MPTIDPMSLVDHLIPAVLEAGEKIMEIYHSDITVYEKNDNSPVTEADHQAEAILLAAVRPLLSNASIIAEEEVAAGRMPSDVGELFWLIDPLDGTKEFIRKGRDFTVNVALVEGDRPRFGLVYAPAQNRLFIGVVGQGAWEARIEDGEIEDSRPIEVRKASAAALDIVASKSHRDAATNAFLEKIQVGNLVSAGSSLKFCLVAAGEADLYPRFGPTMEWDTAAGQAVLMGAGGRVSTPDGQPYLYRKDGFRNGPFIAVGDPALPY